MSKTKTFLLSSCFVCQAVLTLALVQGCSQIKSLPPKAGDIVTDSIDMKLVYIPAGEFMMGSNNGGSNESPAHEVKISEGFYMGVYEVTQAQYQAVMGANPSKFKGDNLPVEQANWDDAVAFCRKLSLKEGKTYRLPTEAEWEYACRAGTKTLYYFGDNESELDDHAWYGNEKSGKQTHTVGQKKPNAFGLYDMYGNVWEWCQDWYGEDYYKNSPSVDPQGPSSGTHRILRGRCWKNPARACRSAGRGRGAPVNRSSKDGFRVVLSVSSQDVQ